ncbi:MAG TPA: NUDIX hydrolase [Gammaproteobacteria bacterium]|nr:NUDIX hydrolase [Gammaproteobacteria bacterium]
MAENQRHLYRGQIVTLEVATVLLPNGACLRMECVRHPGGAAVVALDGEGRVCLLRQYRPVLADWVWELPAGKIEAGEPPLETARRELAEEAGVTAAEWRSLGVIVSSPGVFDERIHLFLARGLAPAAAEMEREATEVFERHWLPLDMARCWAEEGRIQDAKSVIALLRVRDLP